MTSPAVEPERPAEEGLRRTFLRRRVARRVVIGIWVIIALLRLARDYGWVHAHRPRT
jgi:hypothetical protein